MVQVSEKNRTLAKTLLVKCSLENHPRRDDILEFIFICFLLKNIKEGVLEFLQQKISDSPEDNKFIEELFCSGLVSEISAQISSL